MFRALTRALLISHAASAYRVISAPRLNSLRGGASTLMSAPAVADAPAEPVEKFRKDYAPFPYSIGSVNLNFDVHESETLVTSLLAFERLPFVAEGTPISLDGDSLSLRSLEIDGISLAEGKHTNVAHVPLFFAHAAPHFRHIFPTWHRPFFLPSDSPKALTTPSPSRGSRCTSRRASPSRSRVLSPSSPIRTQR